MSQLAEKLDTHTGASSLHTTKRLTVAAVFMAMNIALSSVSVPVPGGHLYINDIVICLAALLFTPREAFFIGGVGAFLGDFFFYPAPMFVSLVTHGLEAYAVSSLVARTGWTRSKLWVAFALLVGAVIMVTGYSLGRAFVYSTPEYAWIKLPFEILQAGIGVVVAYFVYFFTGFYGLWQSYWKR
ncbi:ECF transporter S component [Veillonella magna]|uniref:ECF transporter S component n=1 Tax=Veillonella magna TaxID=464322 RepID=UPI0023F4493E|nr:ECF transporter S component [Veillonella magna]MBD8975187.1 ECF transporter S component [Veillonella magna]